MTRTHWPSRIAMILAISLLLLLTALAAAVVWGGPRPMAPLASINAPFAKVDFSDVPPPRHFTARDGARLAWLFYPAIRSPGDRATQPRRVVLVHGSSARARSMHVLAKGLAQAGFDVAALDMRGHGDSGPRGHIAYLGQLEDDVEDFMRAEPAAGPDTLMGFSSGGGFVLRLAGGTRQKLFDRYVLLSPFLHHSAPTNRPNNGGWVSVGLPRLIALSILNRVGITAWNNLSVLRFGLNDVARESLTTRYDYTLATAFRPRDDYRADIRNAPPALRIVAGRDDELFDASGFAGVFSSAGKTVPVTLVDGVNHMGLTLDARALPAIVAAVRDGAAPDPR